MPDREKVIKGLECCQSKTMLWQHDQCPYHGFDEDCESNLHADALALLKEQEAMNVDTFTQWCIDSHIMGDAIARGIKYWVGMFKEGR